MRIRLAITVMSLLAVATAAVTTAPASARTGTPDRFAVGLVRLDGTEEVQPADPDGWGKFAFAAFGSRLCYVVTAVSIEPASAAHLHAGGQGVAGDNVVGLDPPPTGGTSGACITATADSTPNSPDVLTQSELDAIVDDPSGFYVNVHNAPFPDGAIRGQLD
jgi:hypothetical protein